MFEVSVEVPGALERRVVGERDSYALAEERCVECFRTHFHPDARWRVRDVDSDQVWQAHLSSQSSRVWLLPV